MCNIILRLRKFSDCAEHIFGSGRKKISYTCYSSIILYSYIHLCMCVCIYPGRKSKSDLLVVPGGNGSFTTGEHDLVDMVSVSPSICSDFYQLLGEGCVKGTAVVLLALPVRKVTTRS